MIDLDHDALVFAAKSYGLFYLILLSAIAVAYALWPSNRRKFDRAAKSILDDEAGPCR